MPVNKARAEENKMESILLEQENPVYKAWENPPVSVSVAENNVVNVGSHSYLSS